ncbi:MAG: hypothetical protein D6754_10935 [Alphaproteobacteria bacterium]|nr:MAG: hypothetical protein D6754_10935 [Alphaproteobacteria bacterium]
MRRSLAISAALHMIIILLAMFSGQIFRSDEARAIQISEVELISPAEFDAAFSTAPEAPKSELPSLSPPELDGAEIDAPDAPQTPEKLAIERIGADRAEDAPRLDAVREEPRPDIALDVPAAPEAPVDSAAPEGVSLITPRVVGPAIPEQRRQRPDATTLAPESPARPAPRISTTPAPKPPTDATPAEEASPEVAPSDTATEVAEEKPAEAPPEAATEIVPEVENEPETIESVTPLASAPPPKRPRRPTRTAEARPEETRPAPAASPNSAQPRPSTNRQLGPPVTRQEKEGIALPIRKHWNFATLAGLPDADSLVVEIRLKVTPDGRIRDLQPYRPRNPEGNFRRAFDLARRAILIAERNGALKFPPQEKYERWKEIILTFDPKRNRVGF